jgi:mono/diheme cytochrome c family protein
MRYIFATFIVLVCCVVGVLGFRGSHFSKPPLRIFPDMENQLKLRHPQAPNGFFPNGRVSQPPVAGTVARAVPVQTVAGPVLPHEDVPFNTGFVTGTTNYVEYNQLPVTAELLRRGQRQFNINCSPCHGATADGNGITRKIGAMAVVANLHDRRIVEMNDGELFYVITHGRNLMGAYGPMVTPQDRWAIIAYLRALQWSWLATPDDLPTEMRSALK